MRPGQSNVPYVQSKYKTQALKHVPYAHEVSPIGQCERVVQRPGYVVKEDRSWMLAPKAAVDIPSSSPILLTKVQAKSKVGIVLWILWFVCLTFGWATVYEVFIQ